MMNPTFLTAWVHIAISDLCCCCLTLLQALVKSTSSTAITPGWIWSGVLCVAEGCCCLVVDWIFSALLIAVESCFGLRGANLQFSTHYYPWDKYIFSLGMCVKFSMSWATVAWFAAFLCIESRDPEGSAGPPSRGIEHIYWCASITFSKRNHPVLKVLLLNLPGLRGRLSTDFTLGSLSNESIMPVWFYLLDCLFHHFALIFVPLPWVSMWRSLVWLFSQGKLEPESAQAVFVFF